MQPQVIFGITVLLGLVVWGMIGARYILPRFGIDHVLRRFAACNSERQNTLLRSPSNASVSLNT